MSVYSYDSAVARDAEGGLGGTIASLQGHLDELGGFVNSVCATNPMTRMRPPIVPDQPVPIVPERPRPGAFLLCRHPRPDALHRGRGRVGLPLC